MIYIILQLLIICVYCYGLQFVIENRKISPKLSLLVMFVYTLGILLSLALLIIKVI